MMDDSRVQVPKVRDCKGVTSPIMAGAVLDLEDVEGVEVLA